MKVVVIASYAESLINFRGHLLAACVEGGHKIIACAPGNKDRESYMRQLEDSIKKQAAAKQACLAVRQQGDAFVGQKKYADAAAKYRESLRCNPDPKLEEYVRQLEAEVKKQGEAQSNAARAKQLRADGERLQNQKQYAAAVAKYRESLKYMPDAALEQHISRIEAEMKKQQDQQSRLTRAKQLRDEGAALQKQNRIRDAVVKYRESLQYIPDPALERHIRVLEASLAQKPQTPVQPPKPPVTTQPMTGTLSGSWTVSCNEGTKYNLTITQTGSSFDAVIVNEGERTTYRGTIAGRTFTAQPSVPEPNTTVQIRGTIVSNDELQEEHIVTFQSPGQKPYTYVDKCTIRRAGGGTSVPQSGASKPLTAELTNSGKDNVHIFVEGQDTAGPQNRLSPGQTRTIAVQPVANGKAKFVFMRGSASLGSCYWETSVERVAVVKFTEQGGKAQPVCTTRLR